jgi:hypothetical protein
MAELLYCFRCRRDVTMLDEGEYTRFTKMYAECTIPVAQAAVKGEPVRREAYSRICEPMLNAYASLGGPRDIDPKELLRHRRADYGPLCCRCGKPLRTSKASKCVECGTPVGG